MAVNAKLVSTGKPKKGGAVNLAPSGTTPPTNATSPLEKAFAGLGFCSDAGLTNNGSRTSENVKAWGGTIVLTPQTEKQDTFGLTFIESLNVDVLKAVFGPDNVSGNLEEGIVIQANEQELPYGVWVVDMVMTDGVAKRVVVPNGKITSIDEIAYTDSGAVGYPVTITGFPDEAGNTHYEYIIKTGEASE